MEVGIVRQVNIEQEMKGAYLDYAMSVITSRALPNVRDGLKPVQRRILYAMDDMGLQADKPYKKSARIVGEVLGKYHPHGDTAVYEAMVRMAQDFTMRYLLVDGQGNFGSVDGDSPAAMRYTEARLAPIATEMLADIAKDTVDFMDNFDGTLREPKVLPARVPNLLLNGASGIAVGMATNVPPHNLSELCDAVAFLIDNHRRLDSISVDDLMQFIKGPDFPTGGTILGLEGIRSAYATGNGRITVRAKTHFEDAGGGKALIVVTELPYQVNKAALIEKIADLVRDKRIDTLSDLRDESDRQGMRIVIELKRGLEPQPTLQQLFKYTAMQSHFNVNLLALVDGEPRVLSLKRALQLFIEHRQEVITRRSHFELERAKLRAHILEGLKIALDHLDAIIATIRQSQNAETALHNLQRKFKLTEIQARAILDLQLRRLAALERRKIEEEYASVLKEIQYLEDLLRSPRKMLNLIKSELQDVQVRYGDARRTRISDKEAEEIKEEDLIPEQDVFVAITQRGYVKRLSRLSDPLAPSSKDDVQHLLATNTLHSMLFFTNRGRCFTTRVHQIPNLQSAGAPLSNLLALESSEAVVCAVDVADFKEGGFLTLCTVQGRIKRIGIEEFVAVRSSGLTAIGLENGDELRWARLTRGNDELLLVTAGGQALRFREDQVRAMGRSAAGVNAIKLAKGDRLVQMDLVEEGASLLVLSEKGYAKTTPLTEYPSQSRYGRGVTTFAKPSAQTGRLAAACVVCKDDEVAILTSAGISARNTAGKIARQSRATRGVALVRLPDKDAVLGIVRLPAKQAAAPGQVKKSPEGARGTRASRQPRKKPAPAGKPAPTDKQTSQETDKATGRKKAPSSGKLAPKPKAPKATVRGKGQGRSGQPGSGNPCRHAEKNAQKQVA
ncbi:MAG: DNA gyrase subunit A [Chloroflexi bacterium]|nr:DNA gyrase subunit A [Chloroflexota bacterium]